MAGGPWQRLPMVSPIDSSRTTSGRCDPPLAARLAARMLGCYPAREMNDPETFATVAAAVLARYPEEVARQVTDPVRGLPSTNKWLPSIAEIREACEHAAYPIRAAQHMAKVRAQTIAGRERDYREGLISREQYLGLPPAKRIALGAPEVRDGEEG